MKVWQKVYLTTLAVFLLMLNVALILASNYIFEHNVAIERQQGERECYFLQQNLEHDFSILEENGRMHIAVVQAVVDGYQKYYQSQEIFIELREAVESKKNTRAMVVQGGKHIYIQVERTLSYPYSDYSIFYQKELIDFEETWEKIQATFVLISMALSLLLCVILLFTMQRIFKPLEKLNASVAEISKGNYEQHLTYHGEDEVSELAQNINTMAGTIQTQINQLSQENKKKQLLMDNLAHELRTPLTSIYGYAELLQRGRISEEEMYEGLDYIMRESKRLSKMSEELLSMRLLEKGEVQYNKLSMAGISEHVRQILAEGMKRKRIHLVESHMVDDFYGEEDLYIVLFRNLLENAIRASHEEGVIEWKSKYTGNHLCFEVIDYGIGMEQKELDKIMDAFYRVDKGRSRAEGGAGLGLSIVDAVVKTLGGSIQFETQKGEGTKVSVLIERWKGE